MRAPKKAKIWIKPEHIRTIKEDEKLVLGIAEILVISHRQVKTVYLHKNRPELVLSKPTLRLIAKTLGITVEELTEERPQEVENVPA